MSEVEAHLQDLLDAAEAERDRYRDALVTVRALLDADQADTARVLVTATLEADG
jgi:hypothetical protein